MLRSLAFFSFLATLPLANAQSASPDTTAPSQPAPIVRSYQQDGTPKSGPPPDGNAAPRPPRKQAQILESRPSAGVWLSSETTSVLKTISDTPQRTEIRLDRGLLNVTVHQPAQYSEILIDLPGGQTSLLKDGLYTFNADTNMVRVLRGEAAAFPGPPTTDPNAPFVKIKEDHQLSLVAAPDGKNGEIKPVEAYPYELTADLLAPDNHGEPGHAGYAEDYPSYAPYPYYGGFYGYPGYGFGFGDPFALGFGYGGFGYGGFGGFGGYSYGGGFGYGGGFRGGYGGGYPSRGGYRR